MTVTSTTDRIAKQILIEAPPARVWRALADPQRFGAWFGVAIDDGTFTPGTRVRGRILDPQWAHVPFDVTIERVEPERLLAWRWHPNPSEPGADYSHEPTTTTVFELHQQADGTLLTVVESGFDALPAARRAEAYRGNEDGWAEQMHNIARYVTESA
jgi:uncharacterized protein YndB with AHSA1/START domain